MIRWCFNRHVSIYLPIFLPFSMPKTPAAPPLLRTDSFKLIIFFTIFIEFLKQDYKRIYANCLQMRYSVYVHYWVYFPVLTGYFWWVWIKETFLYGVYAIINMVIMPSAWFCHTLPYKCIDAYRLQLSFLHSMHYNFGTSMQKLEKNL